MAGPVNYHNGLLCMKRRLMSDNAFCRSPVIDKVMHQPGLEIV